MERSIFIARFFFILYLSIGVGALIRKDYFRKTAAEIVASNSMMFFCGLAALIIGSLIVLSHNIWVPDWPVIITIFGWFALIKGFTIMLFPESMMLWGDAILARRDLMKTVAYTSVSLGILLGIFGFFG